VSSNRRPTAGRQSAGKKAAPRKRSAPASRKEAASGGRWRGILRWMLVAALLGSLVLVAIFYFAYQRTEIPDAN
jgi:hypothetical protein